MVLVVLDTTTSWRRQRQRWRWQGRRWQWGWWWWYTHDLQLTSRLTLHRHLINSWLIVSQVLTDSHGLIENYSSVDQDLMDYNGQYIFQCKNFYWLMYTYWPIYLAKCQLSVGAQKAKINYFVNTLFINVKKHTNQNNNYCLSCCTMTNPWCYYSSPSCESLSKIILWIMFQAL